MKDLMTRALAACLVLLAPACSSDTTGETPDMSGAADVRANDASSADGGATEDMSDVVDLGKTDVGQADAGSTDAGVSDMSTNDTAADVDMSASTCTESPNGEFATSDTCLHGAADWLAWKWTAPRDIDITTIELHTDEGFGALFADSNSRPGAVLFEGALSDADADGWRTFESATPVMVVSGTVLWIGENVNTCSTAADGTEFDYFTSDSTAGPWSGPFNAHSFTARISGTCP